MAKSNQKAQNSLTYRRKQWKKMVKPTMKAKAAMAQYGVTIDE